MPSPAYTAVTRCSLMLRLEVLKVAVPPESVPVPSVVVPSLKITVPVAVLGDTVAVKVTFWPDTVGLAEDVIEVVVGAAAS